MAWQLSPSFRESHGPSHGGLQPAGFRPVRGHRSRFRRGTSADPKDGGVSWSLEWVLSMIFIWFICFFLCVFYTVKKGYWSDMGLSYLHSELFWRHRHLRPNHLRWCFQKVVDWWAPALNLPQRSFHGTGRWHSPLGRRGKLYHPHIWGHAAL